MIEAINLVKNFGNRRVLRGLTLSASPGEIVAIIGMNGAGKSTLMRILCTLSLPDAGKVQFNGLSVKEQPAEVRRQIGVVLHAPMLYGNLTGEENLRFFCRLFDLQDAADRIEDVLASVNLGQRRRDMVRTYSRGMQQRLSIARAMLHNPRFLLMDEPYTGLDQTSAEGLDQMLKGYATGGGTVLLATHDLGRIPGVASRVDMLHQGKIAFSAAMHELSPELLAERYREVTEEKPVRSSGRQP